MKKTVVIFANSVKHHNHCVAGKDISNNKWIRPVSTPDGGELSQSQCTYVNPYGKYMVKPLKKVIMELADHVPQPHQPENYLISDAPWVQNYNIDLSEIEQYLDDPSSLWGFGTRVPYDQIASGALKIEQSLFLIKVEGLHLFEKAPWQRRASFIFKGHTYVLPVTDPNFIQQQESPSHHNIVCVSLGEKFDPSGSNNFSCYKIVATIL